MKLELFYPSKPFRVGQYFAENKACSFPDRTGVVSELPDGTCSAGKVKLYPLLGLLKGHPGLDLYAPDGWILRAPHDGVVKELELERDRGLGVGLVTEDRRDVGKYGLHYVKTRQWHGKLILVRLGQQVKCGDPLMLADSTGYSSGSHNHFELKPIEYDNQGNHFNTEQNNGWYGAIDPLPFFNGMYAEDYASISAKIKALQVKVADLMRRYIK